MGILKTIGIKLGVPENVILVCKAYHSRRTLLTYRTVFPLNINFHISPVIDKRGISKDNWFYIEK